MIVANSKIFGGGAYSVAGSNMLRMVGNKRWPIAGISIQPAAKGVKRKKDGHLRREITPAFMPETFRDDYHPTGNSLGYMIQTAHLMGCDPIYCLGFTLANGTGYFHGLENPSTKKRSIYDSDRLFDWLRWYRRMWPGRAKLWPGWSGPVYDVLEVADEAEVRRLLEASPADGEGHQPDAKRADVPPVERPRPLRRDLPLHADGKQPLRRVPAHRKGKVIRG